MTHAINWFELPVVDMARAQKFYETVLETKLKNEDFMGIPHAIFSSGEEGSIKGTLIKAPHRKPVGDGTLIYLNANGKLDACLERVTRAGGKVVMPKTSIGEMGKIAVLLDTEGNQVALHSRV